MAVQTRAHRHAAHMRKSTRLSDKYHLVSQVALVIVLSNLNNAVLCDDRRMYVYVYVVML